MDTSGGSGDISVTGLPFTSLAVSGEGDRANVFPSMTYGLEYSNTVGLLDEASTTVAFFNIADDGAWATTQMTAGAAKYMMISGCYHSG